MLSSVCANNNYKVIMYGFVFPCELNFVMILMTTFPKFDPIASKRGMRVISMTKMR